MQENPKSNETVLSYNFKSLQKSLQKWIYEIRMVLNPGKYFYMRLDLKAVSYLKITSKHHYH